MNQISTRVSNAEVFKGQIFGVPGSLILVTNALAIVLVASYSLIIILVAIMWLNLILLFGAKDQVNFFEIKKDLFVIRNQWLTFIESSIEINKISRVYRQDGVLSSYLIIVSRKGEHKRVNMGGLTESQKVEMFKSLERRIMNLK